MNYNRDFFKKIVIVALILLSIIFFKTENKNIENKSVNEYKILNVIDGDTILIRKDNGNKFVRMIGINAPESTKKRTGSIECYGIEAKNYLGAVIGKRENIKIEIDESQSKEDVYGRMLGYLWIGEENLNKKMIEDGYAYEYTFRGSEYKYRDDFIKAENKASKNGLGLWKENECNGKR